VDAVPVDDHGGSQRLEEPVGRMPGETGVDREDRVPVVPRLPHGLDEGRAAREIERNQLWHPD
jgi:hypothetical protein